jgi:hypothetical protein
VVPTPELERSPRAAMNNMGTDKPVVWRWRDIQWKRLFARYGLLDCRALGAAGTWSKTALGRPAPPPRCRHCPPAASPTFVPLHSVHHICCCRQDYANFCLTACIIVVSYGQTKV